MNTQEIALLYVDDEDCSLKYFKEMFEDLGQIYTASTPSEGLEIFREHSDKIGIVLSDHQMPDMSGTEFLQEVRDINPAPLRFLVTAFADLSAAVDLLNDSLLYSYLSKPWDPEELESRLANALEFFRISQQRDQLLQEKSFAFQQLSIADRANTLSMVSCGLNHHMRNSLNVISSFFELAPSELKKEFGFSPLGNPFWEEFYGGVRAEINRMTELLTHFTEVSTNQRFNAEREVDLGSVFENARDSIIYDDENIEITINCSDDLPRISGDRGKLGQMARQLLKEKVSNLGGGGKIVVDIDRDMEVDGVWVTCRDNGPLLGDEEVERLFDPFFIRSNNPNQLGIDLIGCYLTVYYHGGKMTARHSEDGQNVIDFSLPILPIPPEENNAVFRQLLDSEETVDLAR